MNFVMGTGRCVWFVLRKPSVYARTNTPVDEQVKIWINLQHIKHACLSMCVRVCSSSYEDRLLIVLPVNQHVCVCVCK